MEKIHKFSFPRGLIFPAVAVLASWLVYLPAAGVFFCWDDLDLLHDSAAIADFPSLMSWLVVPNNEHCLPLLKLLDFLLFKLFGPDPLPFHVVIALVHAATIFGLYTLCNLLFQIPVLSSCACLLFGMSAIYAECVVWISGSHILFCLCFMAWTLNSIYFGMAAKSRAWKTAGFFFALGAVWSFSIGLTLFLWMPWFYLLVKKNMGPGAGDNVSVSAVIPHLSGAALAALLYVYNRMAVFSPSHYKYMGGHNALDAMNAASGAVYTYRAFFERLLPGISFAPVSVLLILAAGTGLYYYRRELSMEAILFFIAWIFIFFMVPFTFRAAWGDDILFWGRYYVFPAFGLSVLYAAVAREWFENKLRPPSRSVTGLLVVVLLLFSVHGITARSLVVERLPDTAALEAVSREMRGLFENFFREREGLAGKLQVADKGVKVNVYPTIKGISFYAAFLLPDKINKRLSWGPDSSPEFLSYLESNSGKYPILADFWKAGSRE